MVKTVPYLNVSTVMFCRTSAAAEVVSMVQVTGLPLFVQFHTSVGLHHLQDVLRMIGANDKTNELSVTVNSFVMSYIAKE